MSDCDNCKQLDRLDRQIGDQERRTLLLDKASIRVGWVSRAWWVGIF